MIAIEYISHIRESDKKEQTVSEHCNNVAKIASEFGQAVQMSNTAWLQGILHDAGKLCNDSNRCRSDRCSEF